MALVHVIDIATGDVVAAYPVPPVTNIPVQEGQEVQFVDIPYGNPASPNVIVEVIGDQDVQVTTDDGTVLIEGLFALLEEGAQVRMVFSDTGQTIGDGQAALTVPEFASLDAFAPTAAGGTNGGTGGAPSGTGGRGNDGTINPLDLNEPHIRAVGIDGLIPRPEFDIETDIETDNIQQPEAPIILTPTTAMVWEKGLNGGGGDGEGDGEGGGNVEAVGSSVTVTRTVETSGAEGSVQYVYFTITDNTNITITTDGPTIDPKMYLFVDDGNLTVDDFLAVDDDDGLPAGDHENSIINSGDEIGMLPPGNYIVAVADYNISTNEAVDGINDSSSLGIRTGDVGITIEVDTGLVIVTGGGLTDDPGTMPDTNLEFDFGTLDTGGGTITNVTHPDGTTTDNGATFVVEGTFPGGEGIDWILTVNKATGDFEFELLDNTLDHPGINLIGEDDQVFLTFSYSVDVGGQSASSTLTVGVKDDGPLISLKDGEAGQNMLFEDGLVNVQKQEAFFPTASQGLNFNFGADGPNEDGMGFTIALKSVSDGDGEGGPLPSGLQTSADDLPVNTFYDAASKTLIGFTGEDPFNEDAWVFTVELTDFMDGPPGPGMAQAVFTLYQAIEHPDIDEIGVDDPIDLLFTVTATDGDLDTASVDVLFIVKDDGPNVVVDTGAPLDMLVLDETRPEGTETDGNSNPAGLLSTTANFADNFVAPVDFGADGPGTSSFSLVLNGTNVGSGLYALDPTDTTDGDLDGIGQGDEIVLNQVGNVVTGSANGTDYFTIEIDPDTGVVTFTQLNNIWHGNTGDDDDSEALTTETPDLLQLVRSVTDSDGDSASAALDLGGGNVFKIEDDGPNAVADDAEAQIQPGDTNIVIVFDRSGSMADDPNVAGFSQRIDLARAAVANLLAAASANGAVRVLIVDFASDANSSGWMTVEEANAYLSSLVAGGRTNYEAAIAEVQDAYGDPGALGGAENVVYFLSDGAPTIRSNDDVDDAGGNAGDSDGLTNAEVATWEAFVDDPANDISNAFAVGVGNVPVAELNEVAHPGSAIVVTDESQLIDTLLGTLDVSASGNVLTDGVDDDFGTDGPGQIVSLTHDGVTYFADGTTAGVPMTAFTIIAGVLTLETADGGELVFDFNTGSYSYDVNLGDASGSESFTYTIQDADGDQDSALLTITTPTSSDLSGLDIIVDGTPNNADVLNGTDDAEILGGDNGNDTMNGGGGNDFLYGGDGVDELNGGAGNDFILPGQGDDLIFSSLGSDVINLGSDLDVVPPNPNSGTSDDTVFYTDILHAGDVIHNFDTADNGGADIDDVIDLDALFDNLGVANNEGARFARVQIIEDGTDPNKEEVWIDSNGDAAFDTLLVTVNISDGGDLVLGTDIEVI